MIINVNTKQCPISSSTFVYILMKLLKGSLEGKGASLRPRKKVWTTRYSMTITP